MYVSKQLVTVNNSFNKNGVPTLAVVVVSMIQKWSLNRYMAAINAPANCGKFHFL